MFAVRALCVGTLLTFAAGCPNSSHPTEKDAETLSASESDAGTEEPTPTPSVVPIETPPKNEDAGVPVDAGTPFQDCERLEQGALHLKAVLDNCPGAGDSDIYTFDRQKCEANQAACSSEEWLAFDRLITCDLRIPGCQQASDRQWAVDAIMKCVDDEISSAISQTCLQAITP